MVLVSVLGFSVAFVTNLVGDLLGVSRECSGDKPVLLLFHASKKVRRVPTPPTNYVRENGNGP